MEARGGLEAGPTRGVGQQDGLTSQGSASGELVNVCSGHRGHYWTMQGACSGGWVFLFFSSFPDMGFMVATLAVAVAAAAVRVSKASQNSRQYNCNSSVNELEDGELKLPSA
jgi:hypothetical protein